jgi:predicted nucleotidyltransferase
MTKEEILQILQSLNVELRKKYKADIKGIFGSYVRGDSTPVSDIDVLVQFSASADLFDYVGLSQFLEEKLQCRVDIVPQDSIRAELKEEILKETVYL